MNALVLFGSALWIAGLVVIIANLGWRLWQFRVGESISDVPLVSIIRDVGALLFCLGVSLADVRLWVTVLFAILAGAFATMIMLNLRKTSREQQ